MRFSFIPLVLLLSIHLQAQDYIISDPEKWIKILDFSTDSIINDNGGHYYLLADYQDNLVEQKVYRHFVIKLLNSEGVNDFSNIDFDFDPSYQQIYIHQLNIIRDGIVINNLTDHKPIVLQRESNMERAIYDGSKTLIYNLEDVREKDIIEYSYTVEGFNPLKEGKILKEYYIQFNQPVNQIFLNVITDSDDDFQYKLFDDASEPSKVRKGQLTEYTWHEYQKEAIKYDNHVPAWFEAEARLAYTTFSSWEQVCKMLYPQYSFADSETKNVKIPDNYILENVDTIVSLIRFVQDGVRYLGMESGISAYKPHSPRRILDQRFGDCKDKSLLLVTLMRNEGIEAYPLLVSTDKKHEVVNSLPGFNAFDHCIVCYIKNNRRYFVDPTIQSQGGSYENIYLPNYKYGLLIKEGEKYLIEIPETGVHSSLHIHEIIELDTVGGNAMFTIISDYQGERADDLRSYFESESRENIQNEYLEYYSNLYLGIELAGSIEIQDNERNSINHIKITEHYKINDPWLDDADSTLKYFEVYPIVLESEMDFPNSPERTMPYFLEHPFSFSQLSEIRMYEPWTIGEEEVIIEGDGFHYRNSVTGKGKVIKVLHEYEITKEYIEASSVTDLLKKHERIQNEMTFYITINHSLENFSFSVLALLTGIITLLIAIYLAFRLHKRYNPPAYSLAKNLPIGEWMVLPLIGLTLSPFIQIYNFITSEYFDKNVWISWMQYSDSGSAGMIIVLGLEFLINIFIIVFTVQILISFYQRRTSLPKIIVFFYAFNAIYVFADASITLSVVSELFTEAERMKLIQSIVRSILSAAIWIPYFLFSQRVKDTFCVRVRESVE